MVLPSKIRDPTLDIKNENISSKKGSGHNAHHARKPLKNKKIYLDVKNHSVSSKLEGSLKLLGATIEVFLVKDVNLVVTDRPNWCSGSPLPSPSLQTPTGACSESPATTDSPGGEQGPRSSCKSRAEAMLEKALLQPKQISLDPLDNAVHWGISIWPLEKVLKWLDKVNTDKTRSQDSRLLEKPFIKVETSHRHCPSYKEFSAWPTITLDFDAGGCPFSVPKHNSGKNVAQLGEDADKADTAVKESDGLSESSRMTRKARSKLHQDVCSVRLPGYCEICQVKYSDQKTHVQSESHLQFANNDRNFVSLDLLIKQRSSVDAFLQLNGASELTQCSMLGNPRRSLRGVLKLTSLDSGALSQDYALSNGQHATRASTPNMRQTLDERHLSKVAQHEPLEILCNGMVNHNYETRHGSKVPAPIRRSFWDERAKPRRARTTSASFCNFSEDEPLQLSPTGSDLGHHLRSRGQLSIPKPSPAEDEKVSRYCDMQSPPYQCIKDQADLPNCIGKDLKSKETQKPCRVNSEVIRKKRPSAEEKLIEDNKAYYKLELKNSKLRSSRYFIPHRVSEANYTKTEAQCDQTDGFSSTNGEKIGDDFVSVKVMEETVVKVKKKQKPRRTELSVLSDEAESFMFGEPSRHDSSCDSTEEESETSLTKTYDQVSAQNVDGNCTKAKKGLECGVAVKQDVETNSCVTPLQCDESSLGSVASSCDTGSTRRKRRTHAEAFIHDNLDYYKFEIPGSRLRYQGVNSPNTSACKNVKESKLVNTSEVSVQVSLSPSGAHLGQEEKVEVVACAENVGAAEGVNENVHQGVVTESGVKRVSSYGPALHGLQYSFELVPESEPWYQTYKRQDEGEEVYFPQCEAVQWRTFLLPYEMPSSVVHCSTIEPSTPREVGGLKYKRRRRKKYAHLVDSKPRKSPRCHASTLAILSSLRQNRKRREVEKQEPGVGVQESSTLDESSQDVVSVEPASSKSEICEPEPAEPFQEIERNFEKLLTIEKDDVLSIDVHVQDCELSMASRSSDAPAKFPAVEGRRNSHSCRRKSAQSSRKLNGVNSSKESSEMGPVMLEGRRESCREHLGSAVCLPKPRSGLDSDVLELLDCAMTCRCFDKDATNCRDCSARKCEAMPSLSELSCNSSECSVASTCDSSLFSDILGKNSKSCTKKRKKKKNLTGWPIERHRKKGMKKVAEDEDDCKCNVVPCNLDISNKTDDGLSNVHTPSRDTADIVERGERAEVDSLQVSNCVGEDNPVLDVTSASGHEIAICVPCVERDKHNGLSEINNSEISTCRQTDTGARGSCRDGAIVSDFIEEPVLKDTQGCEVGYSLECGADSFSSANVPKPAKHGLARTVSLEASRQNCEYQPCVRVLKITNLADMLSYSQGAVVANSRRLRSASSPSCMSSPPRRSQECSDLQPRRASPRKRVAKGSQWDVLVGKRR